MENNNNASLRNATVNEKGGYAMAKIKKSNIAISRRPAVITKGGNNMKQSLQNQLADTNMEITGNSILAENITVPDDTHATQNNRNHLVIGSSGSGKTLSYVLCNLLNTDNSFVVSDPKGNLYNRTKNSLEKKGYRVELIDFKDPSRSTLGYNPFDFIRTNEDGEVNEVDIKKIAGSIVDVKEHQKDPYWGEAGKSYCESILGYVMEFLPEEEHNMATVYRLASMILSNKYANLIAQAEEENPNSFAVRRFRGLQQSKDAEKMTASIAGILDTALCKFDAKELHSIYTMPSRIDFKEIGNVKYALFITVSDTDRSLDALLSCFWAQAIDELIRSADSNTAARVKVPVRLFLDDMATNFKIDNFDKIISNIRSREIACSVILQSLSQLEVLYTHPEALTILDNCDTLLYLGGNSVETAEYLSKRMNKTIDSILSLERGKVWVLIRGQKPVLANRYDFVKHYAEMQIAI